MRGKVLSIALVLLAAFPAATQCRPEQGGPYLSIVRDVRFDDTQTVTATEATEIAQQLDGFCFDRNQPDEAMERIRDAFQRRGFFKAVVLDPLRVKVIDSRARPTPVEVAVVVNEGDRYRLAGIELRKVKAFDPKTLRHSIPIKAGDVFDIEKVRQGLKALRERYGQAGYINFTPVPDTQFNETNHTITLVIDCDEGAQFRLRRFEVGAVPEVAEPLLKDWKLKTGDIYDASIISDFLVRHADVLQPDSLRVIQDAQAKTVDVRVVICPPKYYCFDR